MSATAAGDVLDGEHGPRRVKADEGHAAFSDRRADPGPLLVVQDLVRSAVARTFVEVCCRIVDTTPAMRAVTWLVVGLL
jgi:hypothetical protein